MPIAWERHRRHPRHDPGLSRGGAGRPEAGADRTTEVIPLPSFSG